MARAAILVAGANGTGVSGMVMALDKVSRTGVASVSAGMAVIPNLTKPALLHVVSAAIDQNGTDELRVAGDVRNMAGEKVPFRIQRFAFQRYEPGNDDPLGNDPVEAPPRHQWNSYRAMPSLEARAGEIPYLCWNRLYLPEIGRWTSPDPLASAWNNGFLAVEGNPLSQRDSSGLETIEEAMESADQTTIKWIRAMNSVPVNSINYKHFKAFHDLALVESKLLRSLEAQQTTLTRLFSDACKGKARELLKGDLAASSNEDGSVSKASFAKCLNRAHSNFKCCDRVAASMAKAITDAMWAQLKSSGQRTFGNDGNRMAKETILGRLLRPSWVDCAGWANLVRDKYFDQFSRELIVDCEEWLPEQWDMFRGEGTLNPHNWTRFCWNGHCVDVDPWENGTADGTVYGGSNFGRATNSSKGENRQEWATKVYK